VRILRICCNALNLFSSSKAIFSGFYDTLMTIRPSPIVALDRAIAVAQNEGAERGLEEISSITDLARRISVPRRLTSFSFAAGGAMPRASTFLLSSTGTRWMPTLSSAWRRGTPLRFRCDYRFANHPSCMGNVARGPSCA
jgi:hypothetical protein